MNITRMSTAQLEKAIASGKFDAMDPSVKTAAVGVLASRKAKIANPNGPKAAKVIEMETPPIAEEIVDDAAAAEAPPLLTPPTESLPTADQAKGRTPKKKKEEKPAEELPKRGRGRKDPKDYTDIEIYPKGTISGLVRRMIKPKDDSKVAGCTFGEANKAVQKKHERALHPSEFDRNFQFMKFLGLVETKRPPRYKEESGDKK